MRRVWRKLHVTWARAMVGFEGLAANRSLVRTLLISIGLGVAAIQLIGGTVAVLHERSSIKDLSVKRGDAALDMLAAVHTQAMINRNQSEDGDPAIETLNGTMDQFSSDSQDVRLWLVMGPKVLAYQVANQQVEQEGPQDDVDNRVIATRAPQTVFVGDKLRMSRPVILGVGRASHQRCSSCHEAAMGIAQGELIGLYSAEIDLASELAAWRNALWRQVTRSILVMLATLCVVYFLLHLMVIRPLARLVHVAGHIDRGADDSLDRDAQRRDEVGDLARALNGARKSTREKASLQAFLDAVISNLPAIISVKDVKTGRYLLANPAAQAALGLSEGEIVGRTAHDIFPTDQAEQYEAEDQRVIESGNLLVEETSPLTTATGETRYITTRKVATFDDGEARHLVSLGEDVTERHLAAQALSSALESAERSSRAKSSFLANMSHEIRTPLNGVIAVADMLSRRELGADDQSLVNIIRSSGETLTNLLSDILDMARVESGEVTIELAPFHLGDLVRSVTALFKMRADEKGVDIVMDIDAQLDCTYSGDVTRIRQILSNFLSNAVKFTNAGTISVTAQALADGRLKLSVRDSGIGFTPDQKHRVFQRFQQADDSITREFGGTGLGLAISCELASLMGGTIDCESVAGSGSTFWLELDLEPADAVTEDASVPAARAENDATLRVLVADDHPTNRQIAELMLAGVAEVISVENGLEAVNLLRDETFDLVLMDMQMPVMDGLTAVRAIRALPGRNRDLPVIMMTANVLPEHISASLEVGADVHLEKPITAATLFAAIDQAFQLRADAA